MIQSRLFTSYEIANELRKTSEITLKKDKKIIKISKLLKKCNKNANKNKLVALEILFKLNYHIHEQGLVSHIWMHLYDKFGELLTV